MRTEIAGSTDQRMEVAREATITRRAVLPGGQTVVVRRHDKLDEILRNHRRPDKLSFDTGGEAEECQGH